MSIMSRFKKLQWGTAFWLTVMWVLLWGDLSIANVVGGFALAVLVVLVMPLPLIDFKGRIRPIQFLILIGRFLADLFMSSFQVALQAFQFNKTPRGAIVRVKLRSESDLYMTLTSELSCLVPGSLVIEAHPLSQTLYVHVLDLESYGGAEKVRADVLALEARVMRALASREELERARVPMRGKAPHPSQALTDKDKQDPQLRSEGAQK